MTAWRARAAKRHPDGMHQLVAGKRREQLDAGREFIERPRERVIGQPQRLRLDLQKVERAGTALQKGPERRREDHADAELRGGEIAPRLSQSASPLRRR